MQTVYTNEKISSFMKRPNSYAFEATALNIYLIGHLQLMFHLIQYRSKVS